MTHDELTERALSATEQTLDMLERILRGELPDDPERHEHEDPATTTVLLAADQLAFALVRYRAEHHLPQR